jgi:hypothetical protein
MGTKTWGGSGGDEQATRGGWAALIAGAVLLAAVPAGATDGGYAAPDPPPAAPSSAAQTATASAAQAPAAQPTYYESAVGASSVDDLASPAAQVPTSLAIVDANATAQFSALDVAGGRRAWRLRLSGFSRRHERVDAVYDMVLVLPLPALADGRDGFQPVGRGVAVEEGAPDKSVPLIYGGEKVVLKRNVGLEKTLLAGLSTAPSGGAGLPDLSGTGYHWTAWDAIMPRDASYGDSVQASATLRYQTSAAATAPDPDDPRFAAYLITWIPALPASVPPYAVRIDVTGAAP